MQSEVHENEDFCTIRLEQVLAPEACRRIVDEAESGTWSHATATLSQSHDRTAASAVVRSTSWQALSAGAAGLLEDIVIPRVRSMNDETWHFDLTAEKSDDRPHLLRYRSSSADFFDAHMDAGSSNPLRKISYVVQLSPSESYDGGELSFLGNGIVLPHEIGQVTAFPSFLLHRVERLTAGTRYAVVGWLHGPTFV